LLAYDLEKKNERAIVYIENQKNKTIIASLREGLSEQTKIDMTFEPGDEIIFSVKGPEVFLFGMEAPDIDSEDYSDMNSEELELHLLAQKHKLEHHEHHEHEHEHHEHEHHEHEHEHKHEHKHHEHEHHEHEHKHHEHEHHEHEHKHEHHNKRKHEKEESKDVSGEDDSEDEEDQVEIKEKNPEPTEKKQKKEGTLSDTNVLHEVGKDINLEQGLKIVNHTPYSSEKPTAELGDTVVVKYVGKLASNKKEFDSGDLNFTLGKHTTVPGFEVGTIGMQVNGKRTIKIPSALGYGSNGFPPEIPKNANLIFEVQLKSISKGNDKKSKEKKSGKRQSSPRL